MPNINIGAQVSRVQLTRPITCGELADAARWLEQRHGRDIGITETHDNGRIITIVVDESAQHEDLYTTIADIRKEHADARTSPATDTPAPAVHTTPPTGTAETPAGQPQT